MQLVICSVEHPQALNTTSTPEISTKGAIKFFSSIFLNKLQAGSDRLPYSGGDNEYKIAIRPTVTVALVVRQNRSNVKECRAIVTTTKVPCQVPVASTELCPRLGRRLGVTVKTVKPVTPAARQPAQYCEANVSENNTAIGSEPF